MIWIAYSLVLRHAIQQWNPGVCTRYKRTCQTVLQAAGVSA